MSDSATPGGHSHVFLGTGHEKNERKTWAVIVLCSMMMVAEIVGGSLFGSLAVVADGLHMSTHAAAMLIAALAYTYARRHADDPSFAFGTGKLGDLAGFSSAIILAMIALLIGYEAVTRLFHPVAIDYVEAIAIAAVGLAVNIVSAWLLGGGEHGHSHGHDHEHAHGHSHAHHDHHHEGDETHRDNNMRAAFVHVIADAAVSALAIVGLLLAKFFGWSFMDPVMGIVGMLVIANWSWGLVRDTSGILLDRLPDPEMAATIRRELETDGDRLTDLHLWRLGPGHLGAIVSVTTGGQHDAAFYRAKLDRVAALSHVTVEVRSKAA